MTADVRLVEVLSTAARDLCELLAADACGISRVIGDVLILVAEHAPGRSLQLGQGYLVSDYPKTRFVVHERSAYQLTLDDSGADPAEANVVRELGYGALLMLPLEVAGAAWGLVELYRHERAPWSENDVQAAGELIAATAARIP
jgi:GAF domain-containing protein